MKGVVFLSCLLALFSSVVFAEPADKPTLNYQYGALSAECDVIDGVRMVKLYKMDQLWKAVQDSAMVMRQNAAALNRQVAGLKSEVETLNRQLEQGQVLHRSLEAGVNNILVLGKQFPKTAVITVMSFIFLGLVVVTVMLMATSRALLVSNRELKKLNDSTYHEFEEYKHHAVEKQIKLSRELQNYRNRLSDLKIA